MKQCRFRISRPLHASGGETETEQINEQNKGFCKKEEVISNSDKCHENNKPQRERVTWGQWGEIVRLGGQGRPL